MHYKIIQLEDNTETPPTRYRTHWISATFTGNVWNITQTRGSYYYNVSTPVLLLRNRHCNVLSCVTVARACPRMRGHTESVRHWDTQSPIETGQRQWHRRHSCFYIPRALRSDGYRFLQRLFTVRLHWCFLFCPEKRLMDLHRIF